MARERTETIEARRTAARLDRWLKRVNAAVSELIATLTDPEARPPTADEIAGGLESIAKIKATMKDVETRLSMAIERHERVANLAKKRKTKKGAR